MLTFVYAQDMQGGIGYQGSLPWHLPQELQFFKKVTMGHTLVMGRKTFDGMNQRLLPGRRTIVLTRDRTYGSSITGLQVCNQPHEIVEMSKNQELMVIGGAEIFNLFWNQVDRIIRTQICQVFPADVWMPEIDEGIFLKTKVERGLGLVEHYYEWWVRK